MFDSNVLHIAEFMTVAKSLPHLLQKVRKLLIPKLFLSYSCIFSKKTDTYINYEEIFRIPLFFIRRKIVFLQKFDTDPL